MEARLGFSGGFPCPEAERPLWGATEPLCGFLIFSACRLGRWRGLAGERSARATCVAPEAQRRSKGWQASGAGGASRRFRLSVGCRVSRVATLPATPDTDTASLHDNIPEGWRQHPGGVRHVVDDNLVCRLGLSNEGNHRAVQRRCAPIRPPFDPGHGLGRVGDRRRA